MAAFVLLATGCATRSSVNRLRADVTALQAEMTELRQAQHALATSLAREAAETRTFVAESRPLGPMVGQLAAVMKEDRDEVARLRARVEAMEAQAAKGAAIQPVVAPPPAAAAPPAVAPVPPPVRVVPVPPPTPPRTTPAPRPERPREAVTRAESPEQTYAAALATFRAREHGQAVLDFLDFIAKHPRHPLVANAQYWIGEAYYVQRDYRQAQSEFQKVPQIAPGSAKAADALLKIGLCQRNLRDESRARQTWQRVVQEFPQSEAAVKARGFLRTEAGTARH